MKTVSLQTARFLRKDRNADLLRRMENGEKLSSYNSMDSWYPPRPVVEKDPEAISELYGMQVDARLARAGGSEDKKNGRGGSKKVHPLRLA